MTVNREYLVKVGPSTVHVTVDVDEPGFDPGPELAGPAKPDYEVQAGDAIRLETNGTFLVKIGDLSVTIRTAVPPADPFDVGPEDVRPIDVS